MKKIFFLFCFNIFNIIKIYLFLKFNSNVEFIIIVIEFKLWIKVLIIGVKILVIVSIIVIKFNIIERDKFYLIVFMVFCERLSKCGMDFILLLIRVIFVVLIVILFLILFIVMFIYVFFRVGVLLILFLII